MMLYGKMGIGMMELQNAMLAVQDNTTVKELTLFPKKKRPAFYYSIY